MNCYVCDVPFTYCTCTVEDYNRFDAETAALVAAANIEDWDAFSADFERGWDMDHDDF